MKSINQQLDYRIKDTYLICEDKIFTLIMLVVVEADILMLPPDRILAVDDYKCGMFLGP